MMLKEYKAILFDLDGVLLKSMDYHVSIWKDLLSKEGLKVSRDFILKNEGKIELETLLKVAKKNIKMSNNLKNKSEEVELYIKKIFDLQAKTYIKKYASIVELYPHIEKILKTLSKKNIIYGLVTSSRRDVVESCLSQNIRELFSAIITSNDVSNHKPHPEPYLKGAKALNISPSSCLVIENAPAGIDSAIAANTTCYAVSTTLKKRYLSKAHLVFSNLLDIMHYLKLL